MISVLVPTRGRPERLERMMESFFKTRHCAELVFRADDDDQETVALLARHDGTMIVGPRLDGYWSLPAFYNELYHVSQGDLLMPGNDDMIFRTKSWDCLIEREAMKYIDGLFDIGVKTANARVFPFGVVSRHAAETVGCYWPLQAGDIFWRDVMGALGRTITLDSVVIDHEWAGHSPDRTFREADPPSLRQRFPHYNRDHRHAVKLALDRLRWVMCPTT